MIEPTEAEQNETLEFLGTIAAAYKSGGIELDACLEIIGGAFNGALAGDRAIFAYMREVVQQDKVQAQADRDAEVNQGGIGNSSPSLRFILQEENTTWMVQDRNNGLPAQINGYSLLKMTKDDASMACNVLNRLRQMQP